MVNKAIVMMVLFLLGVAAIFIGYPKYNEYRHQQEMKEFFGSSSSD